MHWEKETQIEQIQEILDKALSNKHSNIEKINNINEYFAAKTLANGLYKLSSSFSKSAIKTYKEYINNLKKKIDVVQLLIDYRVLRQCENFYLEEYFIVLDSIDEYRDYLASNNFIKSLFGYDRRNDDYE